jgi:hypothetical protein
VTVGAVVLFGLEDRPRQVRMVLEGQAATFFLPVRSANRTKQQTDIPQSEGAIINAWARPAAIG